MMGEYYSFPSDPILAISSGLNLLILPGYIYDTCVYVGVLYHFCPDMCGALSPLYLLILGVICVVSMLLELPVLYLAD